LLAESTTTRTADGLDFTAIGGKIQGREVPQSLRVWKTQSRPLGMQKTADQWMRRQVPVFIWKMIQPKSKIERVFPSQFAGKVNTFFGQRSPRL
jgi:hypothetical protein